MAFADVLKTFPALSTARLRLRQIHVDHAPAYFREITRLPKVSGWSYGYATRSLDYARMAIRSRANEYKRGKTVLPWAIETPRGKFIGYVQLADIENRSKAELAYWMSNAHAGRGLMTEAVTRVLGFAFNDLGFHRVWATTHIDNLASQRVLTKAGFVKEGVLRKHRQLNGQWEDSVMFGLLATESRA